MAPAMVPVKALAMAEIPPRLYQEMANNQSNLEKAGIWEFVLWARDVEKVVKEDKATKFVHSYQWKTKLAQVGLQAVEFSLQPCHM